MTAASVLPLGLALMTVLRWAGWRWTWTLPGLGAGYALCTLDEQVGVVVLGSSIVATLLGLRWRSHDLAIGGDIAAAARDQFGLTDAARAVTDARRVHRQRWQGRGGLIVGRDPRGRSVRIPVGGGRSSHTLVVGATGSGKTVTQTWIASRLIEQGQAAVILDPKGDPALEEAVSRAAAVAGRPLLRWTPEGPAIYNPFAHGGETEIVDRALAGERYTEPHYLRQAQRYLGHAVRALRAAGETVSPGALVRVLDPMGLEVLGRRLPEREARVLCRYLDSLGARQLRDLAGTRDRLAVLAESDLGRWLDPERPDVQVVSLVEAIRERAVVYFGLEADRRPLAAQMLGAAVVQDLLSTAAALQHRPVPTVIVIDEFSAVAAVQVKRLFARARSAGFSLVLGTQDLADLRPPTDATLVDQVLGNVGSVIAHRQAAPDSAELVARLAGAGPVWAGAEGTEAGLLGRRPSGSGSRHRARRSLLAPEQISGLGRGWAAVIVPDSAERVRLTRVLVPGRDR